ncbi:hypothetical protein B296_00012936 [Ensete ventricosum]|uniref:Uncharacterized protein n=1 Tax=Ensete ventricosum TaxID=4639 RepID=A0A426YSX2_ENSVE|nr:hypothetical protein B296_00012936 [Ensete ventricosum]
MKSCLETVSEKLEASSVMTKEGSATASASASGSFAPPSSPSAAEGGREGESTSRARKAAMIQTLEIAIGDGETDVPLSLSLSLRRPSEDIAGRRRLILERGPFLEDQLYLKEQENVHELHMVRSSLWVPSVTRTTTVGSRLGARRISYRRKEANHGISPSAVHPTATVFYLPFPCATWCNIIGSCYVSGRLRS